jgi:hypothetical protein
MVAARFSSPEFKMDIPPAALLAKTSLAKSPNRDVEFQEDLAAVLGGANVGLEVAPGEPTACERADPREFAGPIGRPSMNASLQGLPILGMPETHRELGPIVRP